jgi:hypothetical protein
MDNNSSFSEFWTSNVDGLSLIAGVAYKPVGDQAMISLVKVEQKRECRIKLGNRERILSIF